MNLHQELCKALHYSHTATDEQILSTLHKMATAEFVKVWDKYCAAALLCEQCEPIAPYPPLYMTPPQMCVDASLYEAAALALGMWAWGQPTNATILYLYYTRSLLKHGHTARLVAQEWQLERLQNRVSFERRCEMHRADIHGAVVAHGKKMRGEK